MFENSSKKTYIIIVILILGVAFLSQKPYAAEQSKNFYFGAINQGLTYWDKALDWAGSKFAKKQAGEPSGGEGEKISAPENQKENNIFENNFLKK